MLQSSSAAAQWHSMTRPLRGHWEIRPLPTLTPRRRLLVAMACGVIAGLVTVKANAVQPYPRDFGPVWFAGRAILHGVNPYPLVGPGRAFAFNWPLVYPLPAGVAAIPLTPLPMAWASVVFCAIGGACFAYALLENGYAPLLGFFAFGMRHAAEAGQWSPILAASLIAAGVPVGCQTDARYGVLRRAPELGGRSPVRSSSAGLAFAAQPGWSASPKRSPRPARRGYRRARTRHRCNSRGVLALLCLTRWRRPARLVAALACVPQSMIPYETLPLYLVPRTWRESASLAVLSYVWLLLLWWRLPSSPAFEEIVVVGGPLLIALITRPRR